LSKIDGGRLVAEDRYAIYICLVFLRILLDRAEDPDKFFWQSVTFIIWYMLFKLCAEDIELVQSYISFMDIHFDDRKQQDEIYEQAKNYNTDVFVYGELLRDEEIRCPVCFEGLCENWTDDTIPTKSKMVWSLAVPCTHAMCVNCRVMQGLNKPCILCRRDILALRVIEPTANGYEERLDYLMQ
jgi:hypothetical protein